MQSLSIAAILALASLAPAQACGTLTVSGTGAPGTSLQIAVAGGVANGFAITLIGPTLGSTSVPLPMGGNLVLGLADPFVPLPIGQTDAAGAAALVLQLPAQLPQLSLNAQAVLVGFSMNPFGLSACASNVVSFSIG